MAPADGLSRLGRIGRTFTTDAVVLRSLRFSEADRILHLYTEDRGRVGAIAKGVRKTRSRFGGRLEPLSHVELVLHEGRGELQTVTGATLVRSHHAIRDDARRSAIGLVGAEAVLAPLPRAGAKRSRVHGDHALSRSPRRSRTAGRCGRSSIRSDLPSS